MDDNIIHLFYPFVMYYIFPYKTEQVCHKRLEDQLQKI